MHHFHQSKIFRDPLGKVNPQNFEVEVDLICENPLIVAECTIRLDDDNIDKVERFVRTVAFLEEEFNRKATAYMMCMDSSESIFDEASLILKEKGIILIAGRHQS